MNCVQENLTNAFTLDKTDLSVESDHFATSCIELRIRRIVQSEGFFAIVSKNTVNDRLAFTVVPCKMPEFFTRALDRSQRLIQYFTKQELSNLLRDKIFFNNQKDLEIEDQWSGVNKVRVFIQESLNLGLSTIISRYAKGSLPIIEIGSGIGYEISSKNMIRIQPDPEECYLLNQASKQPVHLMPLESLYNKLERTEKKVPLIFALDVFDVLTAEQRKISLWQISQLQATGDHFLALLDVNPELTSIIEQIEALHPGYTAVYYVSAKSEDIKQSVLLVPSQNLARKPTIEDFERSLRSSERLELDQQRNFQKMQKELNLKVVVLEDFFAEQMKRDLSQVGYDVDVYYHTSFTIGPHPKGLAENGSRFVWKAVTHIVQKPIRDESIVHGWLNKGIKIPQYFDDDAFFSEIKSKGQKVFAAEILVIAAQKR